MLCKAQVVTNAFVGCKQATTKEGLDAVKAQLKGYSKGMEVSLRVPVHGRSNLTSSTSGAFSCMPYDPGLCKMT